MMELIIKLNENPTPNNCPLCGNETNPNIGAEIFLTETDEVVCLDCVALHSPIIACLATFNDMSRGFQEIENPVLGDFLNFAHLSRLTQDAENTFGAKWEESQDFRKSPMNAYQTFGLQKPEAKDAAQEIR